VNTLFYKNSFIRTQGSFSKFKNKLRTIPDATEAQSLKFSIKVVNRTAASAAQFAKCILLHVYSRTTTAPKLNKQYLFLT